MEEKLHGNLRGPCWDDSDTVERGLKRDGENKGGKRIWEEGSSLVERLVLSISVFPMTVNVELVYKLFSEIFFFGGQLTKWGSEWRNMKAWTQREGKGEERTFSKRGCSCHFYVYMNPCLLSAGNMPIARDRGLVSTVKKCIMRLLEGRAAPLCGVSIKALIYRNTLYWIPHKFSPESNGPLSPVKHANTSGW